MSAETLISQMQNWAETRPNQNAIHGPRGGGGWNSWTWKEYWRDARLLAKGLQALGHEVGECVAIVGNNRPEWSISQFGIMANRGIPAPIYTTLNVEQVAYIVEHSQARIAICDTQEQLDKYIAGIERGLTPRVEKIVTMDDLGSTDARVITFDALLKLGAERPDDELDQRIADLTDTETCLLIYTSGTTGTPKAVMLEHGGIVHMGQACVNRFPFLKESVGYRSVSYLPLCHVAEQLFTTFIHLNTGGEVYYCPDISQIKDYLTQVRPTFFAGVPRVWEKFQSVLEARIASLTGLKAKLTRWALATELAAFKKDAAKGTPSTSFKRNLANKLVISKIKDALGLDQLRLAGVGAAPISASTLEFFASLGITIYEGYGMSETTGLSTLNVHNRPVFGSVGPALEGVTIRIAEDGEILLKGRNMTRGYLRQEDKTAELIDAEGWIHTGDLGQLDAQGNLRITGRKKDLLITAGGKNVAPSEMEGYMMSIPGISQAVVVGDRQPYLCALITLDGEGLSDLAAKAGTQSGTIADMAKDPKIHSYLMTQIEEHCNAKVARYQTIKKLHILPVEFSVDGGEVTPTMKVKRNVVSDKYKSEIEAFYA